MRINGSKFFKLVSGLSADPDKIAAIEQLEPPKNQKQLQIFLGMVTYLGKFISILSKLTKKLRELNKNEVVWFWTSQHDDCYEQVLKVLASPPV
jgi:hypothetical protein